MERYGLNVDQSFAFLRRLSSTTNTKLVDVAREIVETREIPADGSPEERATKDLLGS